VILLYFHKNYGIISANLCVNASEKYFTILKGEYSLSDPLSPDPIWPQLILQFVLILVNAFFAATELAVVSLNENRLRRDAEAGDKKSKRLLRIVEQPTQFLSTIQIAITLAGFLGSAFAADSFAGPITRWLVDDLQVTGISEKTLNTLAVIVITIILSYFTLVLGELVPKRIAMKKPEGVARFACGVVTFFAAFLRPITWLLTVSTNGLLRLFGIDPNAEEEEVSEDEIRMMVDIGEEKGAIEAGEKEMIENIFEFNNQSAEDIMIHRTDMEVIWLDDSPEQILARIEETGLSRFPVCEEDADDVKGILNTRDYLINAQKEQPLPLAELLRPAYFVPESVQTDILFRNMQNTKTHMAIVVDEYGGTSGLVTMEDLLEQIVGNIYDEFDPMDETEILPLGENRWRIAGSTDIESIAEALGIDLPEDDEYDTLGGMILDSLSAVPEDGSTPALDIAGLHIEVQEIKDRRIEWAVVSKLGQSESAEEEK